MKKRKSVVAAGEKGNVMNDGWLIGIRSKTFYDQEWMGERVGERRARSKRLKFKRTETKTENVFSEITLICPKLKFVPGKWKLISSQRLHFRREDIFRESIFFFLEIVEIFYNVFPLNLGPIKFEKRKLCIKLESFLLKLNSPFYF